MTLVLLLGVVLVAAEPPAARPLVEPPAAVPLVLTQSQAPERAPFTLDAPPPSWWQLKDASGQWWHGPDKRALEEKVQALNAVLSARHIRRVTQWTDLSPQGVTASPQMTNPSPPVTYAAPPVTYSSPYTSYAAPSYGYAPSYGSSFAPSFRGLFGGGGGCAGGQCR